MLYRAGRLLDPALDPEGGGADVLKAQVLRSGHGPELADPPGLGGVHELDLGPPPHPGLEHPHVSVQQLLLPKVLEPLRLDEGRAAAGGSVTEGATFVGAAGGGRTQTQLLPEPETRTRS